MHEHIDIDYIAALCRIELTKEEKQILSRQLDSMLEYLDQLREVDVENIQPTLHAFDSSNVLREDEAGANLTVEEALKNAPDKGRSQIIVPRIVE